MVFGDEKSENPNPETSSAAITGARPVSVPANMSIPVPAAQNAIPAEAILNGTVKKGDTVAAGMSKKEITFKVLEKNKNS